MKSITDTNRAGFTLLEVLTTFVILGVIGTLGVVTMNNFRRARLVETVADEVIQVLRRAQTAAVAEENSSAWGVYVNNPSGSDRDYYELFYGSSYESSTIVHHKALPRPVSFTSPTAGTSTTILFDRITGYPNAAATLTIRETGATSGGVTITVNARGHIDRVDATQQSEVITVSTEGSQTATASSSATDVYIGAYTLARDTGSADVTQVAISEDGTITADSDLSNLRLYYETTGTCSYDGGEALFGSSSAFTSEAATISGTISSVGTSQVCLYAVLDIGSGALHGETIELSIADPSSDVVVSAGSVTPVSQVSIAGTTLVEGPHITVGTTGTQIATTSANTANEYIGGAFTFARDTGTSSLTSITITEVGTVSADANLSNIELRYERTGVCTYDGGETLFGSSSAFTSESATIIGSVVLEPSQICVYVIFDVGSGVSVDETIEIQISDPANDIVVSSGGISPASAVSLGGTTVVTGAPASNITFDAYASGANVTGTGNCDGASAWEDTEICVQVPSGLSGSQPSVVSSDSGSGGELSNTSPFTAQ